MCCATSKLAVSATEPDLYRSDPQLRMRPAVPAPGGALVVRPVKWPMDPNPAKRRRQRFARALRCSLSCRRWEVAGQWFLSPDR